MKQELRPGQGATYFKLTAVGYYLSHPSPAGGTHRVVRERNECGGLAASS
jgi:hypothetical protein